MRSTIIFILSSIIFGCSYPAMSQELEPRLYSNLPKGLNAAVIVYGISKGNVLTDPTLPIENFKITAHQLGAGYVRTFGLFNKLARVQATIPFMSMLGKAQLNGRDTAATRTGFGDMRLRFGINLIGSKALTPREFASYEQKTIVGASIVVSIPTGKYYADKRVNIGSNRWALKPEIGVSRRFKHFYVELYSGIWFFANNNEFLKSKTLEQKPVLSLQGHIIYMLNKKIWFGFNANWFNGGETAVDGIEGGDLKDNYRVGGTMSLALNQKNSLKLQFHVGAFTNAGYDYNILVIGYQYAFLDKKKAKP